MAASTPGEYATAFPVDEVVVYEAWTPYATSMATGTPILYPRLDAVIADKIGRFWKRDSVARVLENSSFLVVPLKAPATAKLLTSAMINRTAPPRNSRRRR